MRRLLPALAILLAAATARADEAKLPQTELDKLLQQTDDIARTVSSIRALPIKKTIPRGVMGKPEILKRLIQRLDEDYAPGEIAAESRAMKRLGLMPVDMDYRQTVLDVLTEQIAGFYDPQTRELYIADWIDASMQRIVLAHEIDHALQDQSFDLNKFVKPNRENADEQLARQALVEGDGVAVMIEFMFREQGMKIDPWGNDMMVNTIGAAASLGGGQLLDKAPLILKESLFFPYRDGLRFIGTARKTRPWSDIDGMYARPPLSTEHILHPNKYREGEKPVAVKIGPIAALKTWKRLYNNVFGELGFSVFFRQHGLEKAKAEAAAAGWGGDRFFLYAPVDDPATLDEVVVLSFSSWDAEMDAVEAHEAMVDAVLALTKAATPVEKSATFVSAKDAAGNLTFVERKNRDLLLVIGAPEVLAPKLRAEAWAKWARK